MNEERKWSKKRFLKEEYPLNLLLYIRDSWNIELPNEITPDIRAGIEYAISLLNEREIELIRRRFVERQSLSEIGQVFGVKTERVRQIESKCLRRLREPCCRQFICYGIQGVIQKRTGEAYAKGYKDAYNDGYRKALGDVRKGITIDGVCVNIYSLPIESLGVTPKTCNCLNSAGYNNLGDLLKLSKKDLQSIDRLTVQRRCEVAGGLSKYSLFPEGWNDYFLMWKQKQITRNGEL